MRVTYRSASHSGTGRVVRFGLELHVEADPIPRKGAAIELVLLGSDGIAQVRIVGVVARRGAGRFVVRPAQGAEERQQVRRRLEGAG